MELLMKPHPYEEVFHIDTNWKGVVEFTKKIGRSNDIYHNYISSIITILDKDTLYEECIEYFLVPSFAIPVVTHPTWRKNKVKISSKEIPSTFFKMLKQKHPTNIIYSSHPY